MDMAIAIRTAYLCDHEASVQAGAGIVLDSVPTDELAETITTRDAALLASIAEKDALMREIHHRVKNNLQIISSLLSMQQRALTDAQAKAAVGDTRQRIAASAPVRRHKSASTC